MNNSDHGLGWVLLVVGLILGTMTTIGLGAWQMVEKNTAPPGLVADDTTARQQVLDVATSSIEKILSYDADTTSDDVSSNAKLLTGTAQDHYRDVMRSAIGKASANNITQASTVSQSSIESLSDTKAQVLAFVDQRTSSTGSGAPDLKKLAIRIGLAKVDGNWLIETYDQL